MLARADCDVTKGPIIASIEYNRGPLWHLLLVRRVLQIIRNLLVDDAMVRHELGEGRLSCADDLLGQALSCSLDNLLSNLLLLLSIFSRNVEVDVHCDVIVNGRDRHRTS